MNFLHYEFHLDPGDAIEVTLDRQANVRIMDDANYSLYRVGQSHHYVGGLADQSPVRISPPSPGKWNVVIDLGGYSGTVRASAKRLVASHV